MEGPFRAADRISDINEAMLKAYTEIWAALAKQRAPSAQSGVI
jgi:hypothetical protein